MRVTLIAVVALLTIGVSAVAGGETGPPKIEYLTSDLTTKLNLPFSEAVRVGNILYLSGMIAVTPGTMQVVPGGIEAETRQALENIRAVLERNGSSLDQVFKCTLMLADMSEWSRMNAVYVTFFGEHLPARSAMGVAGLALGARVEIECTAIVGAGE